MKEWIDLLRFRITAHICFFSAGLWGREKVVPGRALVPMMSHAALLCRAALYLQRRWGARLPMTAPWARSPTSWWSHGLICISMKSAALWAIPAPEVSLRQMGQYLRWWEGREKMEVCAGHCQASTGKMVLILAFILQLFCSSSYGWVCILTLSLSNSIAFFNWLVLNRSVLILICSFPLPIAFLNIWLFSCACLQMWTYASNFLSSRSPIICEMRIGLSEPWGILLLTSLHGELLLLRVTFWILSFDKVLLSYLGVLAVVTGSFFFPL